jgi:hypothetical protein
MIVELEHKNIISDNLKDYIKETFNNSLEDCYIYFYLGDIDNLTCYNFIKYLENEFKITVNIFDISNFYLDIIEKQKSYKNLNLLQSDINNAILAIKQIYLNAVENYLKCLD